MRNTNLTQTALTRVYIRIDLLVQGNYGSMSNKLQQNLFYHAIDKVDELNNTLKVPKNPIGGTC